jgi:hypothetical protein
VLIVEIDGVDTEALETRIAGGSDVLGSAVQAAARAGVLAYDAELGGDDDLVAERAQRFADQNLVGARAVDVRRIEEGDAELEAR